MILGFIVPLLILSNIDPLDVRGAAASIYITIKITNMTTLKSNEAQNNHGME